MSMSFKGTAIYLSKLLTKFMFWPEKTLKYYYIANL